MAFYSTVAESSCSVKDAGFNKSLCDKIWYNTTHCIVCYLFYFPERQESFRMLIFKNRIIIWLAHMRGAKHEQSASEVKYTRKHKKSFTLSDRLHFLLFSADTS